MSNKRAPIPKWTKMDLWAMDTSLALIIADAIKVFRKNTIGYPSGLDSMLEWKIILRKIEKGFRIYAKDDQLFPSSEEYVRFEQALDLFSEWFGALWS